MPSRTTWRRQRLTVLFPGLALLAGLIVTGWTSPGYGRVECDPNNEYPISPAAGPWMIIVQSYSGDVARDQAHKLVVELRAKFDLAAYTFNRGKEERDKQEQEMQQRRQQQENFLRERGLTPDKDFSRVMWHPRRIDDQYAVLIGGYKDMDTARRALDHIKKLPAPSQELMDYVGMAVPAKKEKNGGHLEGAYLNPFLRAFVVPNPTVPVQKPKDEPDPLLKDMNGDETYSLLKCSKPWTLAVKEFYGETTLVHKNTMLEKLIGRSGPDTLNASAMQAHEIAKVLRTHMNMEAYVLHTRHGSIVCVGSYDTKDDPGLLQNQRLLGNLQMGPAIRFFAIPLPMEVPRFQ